MEFLKFNLSYSFRIGVPYIKVKGGKWQPTLSVIRETFVHTKSQVDVQSLKQIRVTFSSHSWAEAAGALLSLYQYCLTASCGPH